MPQKIRAQKKTARLSRVGDCLRSDPYGVSTIAANTEENADSTKGRAVSRAAGGVANQNRLQLM